MKVQGWFADDASDNSDTYESVSCLACGSLHFINPKTGKPLGDDEGR